MELVLRHVYGHNNIEITSKAAEAADSYAPGVPWHIDDNYVVEEVPDSNPNREKGRFVVKELKVVFEEPKGEFGD